MFFNGMTESLKGDAEIALPSVEEEVFRALLLYVYTDQVINLSIVSRSLHLVLRYLC